ncbi:MAG: HIT domain-containing protein [Lentisphaerae bacterium]|nr:MAG: HIT domain-containing protein [Lentisphaerota bacterium]
MSDQTPGKRPLWAPWRIEYILDPNKDDDCFLCRYIPRPEDDEKNYVIRRGEYAFALLNRYPYNSGHILIAPYRHVARLAELQPEEQQEIFALLTQAEIVIQQCMNPDGLNIGANLGKAAGAGLEEHLHVHVVPRWVGDTNFMPVIANVDCVPQALRDTAELLRNQWNICFPNKQENHPS